MADRHLEIVRGIYDEWGRGNFRAGPEHFDADVTLVVGDGFPDSGTYRGPDGVRDYMLQFLDSWERVTISGVAFTRAGDRVLVEVHQAGIGRGSGAPVAMGYFHIWTLSEGAVVRLLTTKDRPAALAAGGLPESA